MMNDPADVADFQDRFCSYLPLDCQIERVDVVRAKGRIHALLRRTPGEVVARIDRWRCRARCRCQWSAVPIYADAKRCRYGGIGGPAVAIREGLRALHGLHQSQAEQWRQY